METAGKRKVEVFVAGCRLCDETVRLVKELSCRSCDLTVYNLQKEGMDKAKEYGVIAWALAIAHALT